MIGHYGARLLVLAGALSVTSHGVEAQTPRAQARARSESSVDCQKCHGDRQFLMGKVPQSGQRATLYVTDSILRDTKHAGQTCTDCHPGFDAGFPHTAPAKAVPCASCHETQGADWAESIHAVDTNGDTPTCVSCHTAHTVFGADDRRSPTHALNVAELCGTCHADEHIIGTYFSGPEGAQAREAVAQYHTTVHGVALTRAGLLVSATCNDCHRAHKVLPADSAESSVNRANIAETCGACHLGILDVYRQSAHGTAYETGVRTAEGREAPVCVECHSSHEVVRADQPDWFLGMADKCGSCHGELLETYLGTYHGKVTRLGGGLTAKCSDCHTPHDMLPATDTASSVFPTKLVATCSGCHPKANQNFVKYHTHADEHQRNRYPLMYWTWLGMTSLLVGVFSFFGLHTLLWLTRLAIDGMRSSGRSLMPWAWRWVTRAISASHRGPGPYFQRFTVLERTLHAFIIISFFGLVITGIPLHFSSSPWAGTFVKAIGGFQTAGFVHRFCAILTFGYFFTHVATLTVRAFRSTNKQDLLWGPNSMVPQPKDILDIVQQFRWFLGLGPRPKFDRFSYMEKFDYWAVFWGVAIIGGSGLLLWFPEFFSLLFPGWIFNIATIVHGDEALLALGFIFTIHFFNVHLRPEKFPIDVVIFTGSATEQYMEEEHPLEYERLKAEGRLESLEVEPPSTVFYGWSIILGFMALALGIGLIGLVIWSVLQ